MGLIRQIRLIGLIGLIRQIRLIRGLRAVMGEKWKWRSEIEIEAEKEEEQKDNDKLKKESHAAARPSSINIGLVRPVALWTCHHATLMPSETLTFELSGINSLLTLPRI